uniref:Ig-like domain-containing protein n=1 Tax=Scleropages formosus TaxID=113540 RepID=A0A8C9S5S8_SCLFO
MYPEQNVGFKVLVPLAPVVSIVGHDIILLCHLSPEMSAASKEIRWFKESFTNLVFLWDSGKVTEGKAYEGRVTLFPQELERGNVSLLLRDVRISDEGQYSCHVSDASWYEEPSMNLLVMSES